MIMFRVSCDGLRLRVEKNVLWILARPEPAATPVRFVVVYGVVWPSIAQMTFHGSTCKYSDVTNPSV